MEEKWFLCTCLSLIGFLALILCLNHGQHVPGLVVTLRDVPMMEDGGKPSNETVLDGPVVTINVGEVSPEYDTRVDQDVPESETPVDQERKKWRWEQQCDIFDGRWVYDPENYPLYRSPRCPFLSDQVSCQKNGRPDSDYESWRWEARHCDLPRFNGTDMLERLRGKRVVIVGDSLNRNQWESLSCLLYAVVPPSRAYVNVKSPVYKVFRAKDYDCTVEFFWSPFLVELEETLTEGKVLKLDKIPSSARQWRGADIIVFNSGHWWVHSGKHRAWDTLKQAGKKLSETLEVEVSYQMAMKTWAHWIDRNVDPSKTTVFFRSISPEHKGGNQWCYNKTIPIMDDSYVSTFPSSIQSVVEKTITKMKTPVKYLNITRLSEYRIDAHTTLYTVKQGQLLSEEQRKRPHIYADCSHWCLPGLPDTWNVLLYASIIPETPRDVI